MSKMNELMQTLDALAACGETLIRSASSIREMFKSDKVLTPAHDPDLPWLENPEPKPVQEETPAVKAYTKEEIRALLADLSQNGFRNEVKELVRKYSNGGSLTDVDPAHYPELAEEAQKYHA